MSNEKTKLTLTIDKEIIKQAKQYANNEEDVISHMVEDYLETYIAVKKNKAEGKEPFFNADIAALSGSFKLGKKRDYKKEFKA